MPLLADTIVECARRTLKNTVDLANEWGRDVTGKWFGCRCVYGDTDSVFVRLPGRTVKEAFQFGEALCSAVTRANPPPVQLKLEKASDATMLL
jgi:DNA polymerase zeta